MADYPADYDFDVVLKDGAVIRIRPITPDDGAALQTFFAGLGRETVYHRFFRIKDSLTDEEVRYFTNLDYRDRMAFVAIDEDGLVAVGRYDRLEDDPEIAEVAFVVADAHQARGIGTALLRHLTAYARTQDVSGFRAYVLADNHGMLRVFRNSGYTLHRDLAEGVYTVDFPTDYSDEAQAAEAEQEKRAVASSLLPIFYPASVATPISTPRCTSP